MALVERDQQLELLRETIAASRDTGHGRLVLIAGEPGAGKTALVRAAIGALPTGTRNLLGGCDRLHTSRPLSPVLDWADQADPALAAMVRRGSSLHESLDAVIALVSAGPTVAVLEDAHWADDATIDLVIVLARRLERMSTTLIVTYRPEEAGPGSSLALALGDLATTGPLRISVPALTAAGVDALVAGRPVDVAELLERTGGNAFFVTECLSTDEAIPRSVSDAVLSRVHQLDAFDRDALSALSVCPNRCELWLARALDVEPAALDRCVAAGVLEAGESWVAFRHELAREAVYATVAPARRQELHRKALQALEARMSAQHDAAGATHHAAAAGDIDAVVRYAPQAALLASIAGSRREAVAHLTLALRYADRLTVPERRDLFIRLGEQLDRLGQDVASVAAYRSALDLTDDNAGRVEIWLKLWTPLSTSGSVEAAIDVLNAATAVLEAGPPSAELGSVFAYRCSAHMLARQFALAEEWGQRAMAIAAEYNDVETLAYVKIQSGVARWMQGDPEGMPRLQAGVSLARDHGIDALVARGLQQVGSGGGENRWYDEAIPALEECIEFAAAHELGAPERYATAWLGRCQVELGRWAAAALTLQRVVDAARADRITRVTATTALGRLHARRGDADPWERLDVGLVLARESGHLQRLWPVAAARCEAAWLEGRLPDELDNLTAVYELALGLDQPWATEELAFWLWRGGHAVSVAVPRTPFADHLGGGYELAARKWEALGCPYEQATALADSASDEHQRAALVIFADLGAAPASRRLIEQRRRAGRAVPRGPNAATRGNAGGLTGRELDVLRLVAIGRTNAEIATELVMSPRTVGHHVSHILAKLEASNRAEAVSLAARAGVELRTI